MVIIYFFITTCGQTINTIISHSSSSCDFLLIIYFSYNTCGQTINTDKFHTPPLAAIVQNWFLETLRLHKCQQPIQKLRYNLSDFGMKGIEYASFSHIFSLFTQDLFKTKFSHFYITPSICCIHVNVIMMIIIKL